MPSLSRLLLIFTVVATCLAASPALGEAQKIGVVDMQRALNETEDGRAAKAKLEKFVASRQKTLNQEQEALKQMESQIKEQQKLGVSQQVLAKKFEDYQKKAIQLQSSFMEFQRELAAKEAELTKDIVARMTDIMKRVGQKEGYSLILDRASAGVVFVPGSYDLTDILIQKYNAQSKKKKK